MTCDEFELIESTFKSKILTYSLKESKLGNLVDILIGLKPQINYLLNKELETCASMKFNIFIECEYTRNDESRCNRNFKTRNVFLAKINTVDKILDKQFNKLNLEKSQCELKDYGWIYNKMSKFQIRINI